MKRVTVIIDCILTFFAVFLLSAAFAGYFYSNAFVIVLFSLVAAPVITFLAERISFLKAKPKREKQRLNELLNKIIFSPAQYADNLVYNALKNKCETKRESGFLIAGKTAFCVCITAEPVKPSFLAERYSSALSLNVKRLVFLSGKGGDAEATATADMLINPKTEIWDFEKVYDFLKSIGGEPTERLKLNKPKSARKLFKGALDRKNARRYLISAIVLLTGARFMPHAMVYIAFSSVLIVLAVLSMLPVKALKRIKR